MKRRVVITGMGINSSIGTNINDFWANCLRGQSVIEPIPEQWLKFSDYHSKVWSPLPKIDFSRTGFGNAEQYQLDPVSLLAMDAAFQALENAKLPLQLEDERRNTYSVPKINGDKAGVYIGTGVGGINTTFINHSNQIYHRQKNDWKGFIAEIPAEVQTSPKYEAVLKEMDSRMICPKRFNPFTVSMLMPNAPAANISIKFNLTGPNNTLCAACASGTVAIGHGFNAVQAGLVDLAVAGGAEYLYDEYGSVFRGFDIVRTLASMGGDISKVNRPFDERRSGFLFSQGGAGVLIIEELEHAMGRQADILAEIVSFAETSDGYNIMIPEEKGAKMKLMFRKVLENANLQPEEIDYINAHGTGTVQNDLVEAKAMAEIFGKRVPVNSTKSLLGHSMGASGGIETIVTVLSLLHQTAHECKNLENPVWDLNFVREVKSYPIKTAITQSFAFGGHNAALVLKEWKP